MTTNNKKNPHSTNESNAFYRDVCRRNCTSALMYRCTVRWRADFCSAPKQSSTMKYGMLPGNSSSSSSWLLEYSQCRHRKTAICIGGSHGCCWNRSCGRQANHTEDCEPVTYPFFYGQKHIFPRTVCRYAESFAKKLNRRKKKRR